MEVDGIETYYDKGEEYTKESLIAGIINHLQLSEAIEDFGVKKDKRQQTPSKNEKFEVKVDNNGNVSVKPKEDKQQTTYKSQIPNYSGGFNISSIFNINAAITEGIRNAHSRSTGYCGKYVRYMLEKGFGLKRDQLYGKTPGAACNFDPWLKKSGFMNITNLYGKKNQLSWTHSQAMPGDIAVMDHGEYGHICMFNGHNWVSDFVQNNMWVYGGDGTCRIYRHAANEMYEDELYAYYS